VYIFRYRTSLAYIRPGTLRASDQRLAVTLPVQQMLIGRLLVLVLAYSHALEAGALQKEAFLARSDEEFATADGGAVKELQGSREIRGAARDRGGAGKPRRHARSSASKAVFPAVLVGFVLVFGFFWDDSEGELASKITKRMELWAPPAVCEAGRTRQSSKGTECSDVCVLPVLSSDFVRACSTTQLAVGCVPLGDPDGWSTDVLGFMGVPLLSAVARPDGDGGRIIEIRRRGGSKDDSPLVAVKAGQVSTAGRNIGRFTSSRTGQQVFEDSLGLPLLVLGQSSADHVLTMSSASDGQQVRATAAWRAASAVLPTEHLEVSAKPGVDAALALLCALATLDAGDACRA